MHRRTAVLDIFSTFARFTGDRFESWISDRRLVRSMEKQMAQQTLQPKRPEAFWAVYWYQQWQQTEPLALRHLCAYLQEPCYWAAENVTRRFVSTQFTLADGFQTAIAHLKPILTRYDPTYGSSLKAYAHTAFGNVIRNQLRQQKAADICSDWGLLRKLSQAQLKRSLLAAGFIQTDLDILIWQCFQAICIPNPDRIAGRAVHTLKQPTAEQLSQIAERYPQQRAQLSTLSDQLPAKIDAKTVAESLKRSVQAARSHLTPDITSLNQPQYDDGKERIDDLAAAETPLAQMLAAEAYAEQQQKVQAIEQVLGEAIAQLAPSTQMLLCLYYQQQLTQKEIASQLQIQQYQVSRQLSRARQQLLLSVAKWSQETLHISIESAVLASMSAVIHEWLQRHYASETTEPMS